MPARDPQLAAQSRRCRHSLNGNENIRDADYADNDISVVFSTPYLRGGFYFSFVFDNLDS